MEPYRLALAWVLILCTLQTPAPVSEPEFLNRQVALDHLPRISAEAISFLLAQARAPGGIISIYSGCAKPNPQTFSLAETSLKQGLDYVSTVDPARKWTYADGLILVGLERANDTILNTLISDIEIRPGDALSLSAQRMLHTSEVQTSIEKAGLNEITPELGFGQISRNPKPSVSETSQPNTRLQGVTLAKALNTLASMKGTAVWEYEQFTCNGKSSFRLTWLVK
jgi:hypothetical protein